MIENLEALIDKFDCGDWVLSDTHGVGIITDICIDKRDEDFTTCYVVFLSKLKMERDYYKTFCFLSDLTKLKQKEGVSLELFCKV